MSAIGSVISAAFSGAKAAVAPYMMYAALAGTLVLVTTCGIFWWQKNSAEKMVTALTLKNDRLESQIAGLNVVVIEKNTAIRVLEADTARVVQQAATIAELQQEIANAPASDDAPLAPVLDRAIDSLDRLRKPRPK